MAVHFFGSYDKLESKILNFTSGKFTVQKNRSHEKSSK